MRWLLGALLIVLAAGCGVLGATARGTLPPDVNAPPDPAYVASHPCRFGDVAKCVARCQADDPQACNAAGVLFEFSDGTTTNPALASGFYSQACSGNYGPGCNNLAWLYLRGRGVPEDHPHAMHLFMAAFDAAKIACNSGDASGCLLAGELLYEGRGVKADEALALAYFERACEAGEARGCEAMQ